MNLCLCFHCVCESYDDLPSYGRELYVSLADLEQLVDELGRRGFTFGSVEDTTPNTVSLTFDYGYYNNLLIQDFARRHSIPYVVFVSPYYSQTGEPYPWLADNGSSYSEFYKFDFYTDYEKWHIAVDAQTPNDNERPMTVDELRTLNADNLAEIGCHGYYHQALALEFEGYVRQEMDLGLAAIRQDLGVEPRYYALANGMYTKKVLRSLLDQFQRVFTIEGTAFHHRDSLVHRLTLVNPQTGGPLLQQIERHMMPLRRVRRAIRTFTKSRV